MDDCNKSEMCTIEAWVSMGFKEYFDKDLQTMVSDVVQLFSRGFLHGFSYFDTKTNEAISWENIQKMLLSLTTNNDQLSFFAFFDNMPIEIIVTDKVFVESVQSDTFVKIQINSMPHKIITRKHWGEEKATLDLPFYINAMFLLSQDFMIYHFNAEIKEA